MRVFRIPLTTRIARMDLPTAAASVLLSIFSILILISGAETFGASRIIIQSIAVLLGIAMMTLFSFYDYEEAAKRFWIPLIAVSVALLVFTALFGAAEGSNSAWIRFGPIGIQPSEFVKVAFILSFSRHLDLVKKEINKPKNVLALALHVGVIVGSVLLTGDLGSALVFVAIALVMLFCAGLSLWYFLALAALAVIAFPFVWPHLAEYQQQRILVGFNPELDPYDKGYQALMSRSAIANGGFWGRGFSGGEVYRTMFAASTDFVYATMLEKFGFLAALLYFALLGLILFRLIRLARSARKDLGAYICAGICALILTQTAENVGMCLAMLPVIGITLPFLSYGGSSVLSMFLLLGLAQSVKSHNNKYNFERESA